MLVACRLAGLSALEAYYAGVNAPDAIRALDGRDLSDGLDGPEPVAVRAARLASRTIGALPASERGLGGLQEPADGRFDVHLVMEPNGAEWVSSSLYMAFTSGTE
jgi:hypothetical protein